MQNWNFLNIDDLARPQFLRLVHTGERRANELTVLVGVEGLDPRGDQGVLQRFQAEYGIERLPSGSMFLVASLDGTAARAPDDLGNVRPNAVSISTAALRKVSRSSEVRATGYAHSNTHTKNAADHPH